MLKPLLILCAVFAANVAITRAQATVHVQAANINEPRALQQQTADAAIQDYLQSWQALQSAFAQNRAELLDADFVGDARDKLGKTIQQQATLGISTRWKDSAHDLQIVFYSPEGLSIELTDDVDYYTEILEQNKTLTKQHLHARYIALLTPSDSRWRVRILQASPH